MDPWSAKHVWSLWLAELVRLPFLWPGTESSIALCLTGTHLNKHGYLTATGCWHGLAGKHTERWRKPLGRADSYSNGLAAFPLGPYWGLSLSVALERGLTRWEHGVGPPGAIFKLDLRSYREDRWLWAISSDFQGALAGFQTEPFIVECGRTSVLIIHVLILHVGLAVPVWLFCYALYTFCLAKAHGARKHRSACDVCALDGVMCAHFWRTA